MGWLANMQTHQRGVLQNTVATLAVQAVAVAVALLLASMRFSEATVVIVYVLGVLLTAVFTTAPRYCFVAAVLSILSFNYFYVDPRFSFRIEGADVPGTMVVMFVVAMTASYLVTLVRRSMQASAEAAMTAKNEQLRANLLRSVSHDLRTPLTAISGNAALLLDREASLSEAESRKLERDIYEDATWLTGVVENLLTITRLEDGKVALGREVEDVGDVVEEALRHVSDDVSAHRLSFEPAEELLLSSMDAQLIVQVVVNLVNNAIAYSGAGSSIVVAVRRDGPWASISVADDGVGIADEDSRHLFDSFYSSNRAVADGRRGIGLGLSLCRSIVEAHGGTISHLDAKPHGAVFVFTLPLEEVPAYG